MTKRWLVALDVDRTTLTDDYCVLPIVREAVAKARQAGVYVALVTARAPEAVRHVLKDLGDVDATICFGGALAMLPGENGWQVGPGSETPFILPHQLASVVLKARELDVPLAAYTIDGVFVDRMESVLEDEFRLTGMTGKEHDLLSLPAPVAKVLAIGRAGRDEVLHNLRHAFAGELACVFSHENLLEIMKEGISKGNALLSLANTFGVSAADTIAIGDSENDLSMFAVAGLAIAMGNATDEVKVAAHRVTTTNNEGGVAAALLYCHDNVWKR